MGDTDKGKMKRSCKEQSVIIGDHMMRFYEEIIHSQNDFDCLICWLTETYT